MRDADVMSLSVSITIRELVASASNWDRDAMVAFVKALDLEMADWDFTLALCEHFSQLKIEYELERAADETARASK